MCIRPRDNRALSPTSTPLSVPLQPRWCKCSRSMDTHALSPTSKSRGSQYAPLARTPSTPKHTHSLSPTSTPQNGRLQQRWNRSPYSMDIRWLSQTSRPPSDPGGPHRHMCIHPINKNAFLPTSKPQDVLRPQLKRTCTGPRDIHDP